MENTQVKLSDEIGRDWEYMCMHCGRITFSMTSSTKALFCRNCNSELVPVWFPLNVPRYAVPNRIESHCPHCWEPMVVTLPLGKVPFGKSEFSCRHCLGKVTVNFRTHPIAIKKARQGK